MKRITHIILFSLFFFIAGANLLRAQALVQDFEGYSIGDSLNHIGWSATDVQAKIADDPLASGNNVLQNTIHNYNAAPVLMVVLPSGKTLADYDTFTFKGYFAQGDVGYKDIIVEAYQTMPTAQAYNNASVKIGSWTRAQGGSSAWEDITIDITNSLSLNDTIYIAFGINCAGTGDVGGTGLTTMWYADNVSLVEKQVDTTLVSQWGRTNDGYGAAWPILNDSSTAVGDAGIAGSQPMPSGTNGASIRGGFDSLVATTSQAVVVSGQLEYVGGGMADSYTPLRYAITYQDSTTLMYQYTDSAKWVRNSTNQGAHYGYELTPRSSTGTQPNGAGGGGSVWTINNGNWASTYSNGGKPIGSIVNQAPRNAEISAGTYNFAISVMQVNDTTNEIRWYIEKTDNSYWFGGTVVDTAVTTKFNSVSFWLKDGNATQFNLKGVSAKLGDPITVPAAPWQAYYLDQWGLTNDGYGAAWPILNDSDYVDGDAGIAGSQPMPSGTNGASLRGGFGQDVSIPTDKAVIVSGQMEYVGGGMADSYTPLRYAITYQDSTTLMYQYTDSAKWVRNSTNQGAHYGYELTPRSSTGTQPNGAGGGGSIWTINNGNWASTYSNGGAPYGIVNQAPRNAEISAGKYNWAISVQQVNDTTDEVRWYIEKTDNSYWFGGTVWAPKVTDKFNGVSFWLKDGNATQFNILAAKIDLGTPITVPPAPWQAYYLDQWGLTNDGYGAAWPILNDSDYVDGDAGIAGSQPMPSGTNGASLRGGFGQDVSIPTDKAVIVSGQMEYVGGGMADSYTPLRYAITYQDSTTLMYQYTDSAKWVRNSTNQGAHYGYELTPRSSTGTQPNGAGGGGSIWTINNGNWASTYSNGGAPYGIVNQAPRNAEISAGKYNWAISVQQVNDTTDEVRWYIEKVHAAGAQTSYWFAGTVWAPKLTDKFNGVSFWLKDGNATQFNILAAKIDKGDPITLPPVPWQQFYVPADQFGIYGTTGGWKLTPDDVDGNASISGSGPVAANQWANVRGGFGEPVLFSNLPPDTALVVTGKMEFVGGGFDGLNGLRFGLFYSDSAGTVDSTADGPMWSGSDAYSSGYLFAPNSGTNDNPSWAAAAGNKGGVGGIVNSTWYSTQGANSYVLGNQKTTDVAGAGTYTFKLSFKDMGGGVMAIGYSISGPSYLLEGHLTDNHNPFATSKFNSINFAVSGTNTSTTGLNLKDVLVDLGSPIIVGVSDNVDNSVPTVYTLSQNYPNPFNPTTTIEFALPQSGDVNLAVYDILGRKVIDLVNGNLTAGYHTVNFNASNLSSGVYFYRIQAGDFVSVKKLMLLK